DLPYSPNGCPQVILKRIRGDAEKYIHQPVVPDLRQERLFVTKGIGADDLGSRVGNLHDDQVFPRHNADRPNEPKRVLGDTLPLNYPLVSVRRCIRDSARKLLSELEGVNRVSEVLWARYPQILRNFLELIAIKTDLNGTRLVVAPKNLLNNRRVTILSLTRHLGTLPVGQSPLRPSQSILGDRGSHQLLFRHIEVSNLALTNRQNVPTNRPEPPSKPLIPLSVGLSFRPPVAHPRFRNPPLLAKMALPKSTMCEHERPPPRQHYFRRSGQIPPVEPEPEPQPMQHRPNQKLGPCIDGPYAGHQPTAP